MEAAHRFDGVFKFTEMDDVTHLTVLALHDVLENEQ